VSDSLWLQEGVTTDDGSLPGIEVAKLSAAGVAAVYAMLRRRSRLAGEPPVFWSRPKDAHDHRAMPPHQGSKAASSRSRMNQANSWPSLWPAPSLRSTALRRCLTTVLIGLVGIYCPPWLPFAGPLLIISRSRPVLYTFFRDQNSRDLCGLVPSLGRPMASRCTTMVMKSLK